jgi:hypothetical protein
MDTELKRTMLSGQYQTTRAKQSECEGIMQRLWYGYKQDSWSHSFDPMTVG